MQIATRLKNFIRTARGEGYKVEKPSPPFPFDVEGKRTLLEALQEPINPTVEEILGEIGRDIFSIYFCKRNNIPLETRWDGSINVSSSLSHYCESILPYFGYRLSPVLNKTRCWFLEDEESYNQLIIENPELEHNPDFFPHFSLSD